MRRKDNIAVLLLASVIILLGMAELPLLYACFFDAVAIIGEQEPLVESLETAPRNFIKTLQEPLWQESQPRSQEAVEYFLADGREYSGIYERLFEMAGLSYDEVDWDGLSTIKGTNHYRIDVERSQEEGTVSVVFDMALPVLLYDRSSQRPTAQEIKDAVTRLEGYATQGDSTLLAYLQKIDQIYEGCEVYENQLAHLYLSVSKDATTQEVTQAPTLQSCCSCGTWRVYSDDTEVTLTCLMERSCLILYYDAAHHDFCGYRIVFHATGE